MKNEDKLELTGAESKRRGRIVLESRTHIPINLSGRMKNDKLARPRERRASEGKGEAREAAESREIRVEFCRTLE